jgi:hypothetical protein
MPSHERFVEQIIESWRETGGKADVALDLPPLLSEHGFVLRSVTPRIFTVRPNDYMWQWPAAFIESGAVRLRELNRVDEQFVAQLRAEFARAEASPNALMITPLVLEIIAEKT